MQVRDREVAPFVQDARPKIDPADRIDRLLYPTCLNKNQQALELEVPLKLVDDIIRISSITVLQVH